MSWNAVPRRMSHLGRSVVAQGEHEHKPVSIIVNTRQFQVEKDDISFEEVVALAFPTNDPNQGYSVTYHRAEGNKSGEMLPGETVKVKDGMVFDVTRTTRS
jgi:Multiubiquitin